MRTFTHFHATSLLLSGLFALALAACGGSENDSVTAPEAQGAPAPTPVAVPAPSPVPEDGASDSVHVVTSAPAAPELVSNNNFSNGLASWTVSNAVLIPSSVRPGGKSLNIGSQAKQRLSEGLKPRTAYTLTVRARNASANGTTPVKLSFSLPSGNERFRTYQLNITSSTYQDIKLDFTSPEYAALVDLTISTAGMNAIIDSVSIKARARINSTEPIIGTDGSYVPDGYALVFNDEFNGTSLNRSKWATRFIYGSETLDRLNDEKQRYRDNDNHSVANGILSLTARKANVGDADAGYESGLIRSLWTGRYGYYEARVKMPGGLGVWPAFWLNSDVSADGRLGWPPEIDIFEFVNNGVEDKLNMLHSNVKLNSGATSTLSYADAAFNKTWTFYAAPFNFNEGWHTVGAEWTPTQVSMFVDGKKIYTRSYTWTYADGTLGGPAHILLNLAIGGAWAGRHGIDDTAFPQALQIDWVRAYQKSN